MSRLIQRVFFAGLACAVLLIGMLAWRNRVSSLARAELMRLFRSVDLAMTPGQIMDTFERGSFRYLTLRSVSNNTFIVSTPLEWGAANWVMWLDVSNNTLGGVRIRYQDSAGERPGDAPP